LQSRPAGLTAPRGLGLCKKSVNAALLDLPFQPHCFCSASTLGLPYEKPWSLEALGGFGKGVMRIVVLLKPFFQIVGLAAVVSSSALTLDYVNPISHEQKRPGFPWPVLSGSPCATFFITVLVLRLLTENLQYQRVIKDQVVPGEAEAASNYISLAPNLAVCVAKHVAKHVAKVS
jgi:hypothetical protein